MKKIETLAEYAQLASRTCPDLGNELLNTRHMDLGVLTEAGEILDIFKKNLAYKKEIDVVNLCEETADLSWYAMNKILLEKGNIQEITDEERDILNVILHKFANNRVREEVVKFIVMSIMGSFLSANHPVIRLFHSPVFIFTAMEYICNLYGMDYFQALTNNIEKLRVRYPEKFTEENALNRNLDAEREKLEQ